MPRSIRRVLYTEQRVRQMFAHMRAELDEMAERHASEAARLRQELEECRAAFDALRSISLARSKAELEVAELRRLQAIGRARAAERDLSQPLQ